MTHKKKDHKKHKHEHNHHHTNEIVKLEKSPKLSDFSIFNNVTVNAPVKQAQEKEDGLSSCFKAMFQCCKPK